MIALMLHCFTHLCKSISIIHETPCIITSQQNMEAERKIRHLLQVAQALLFQTGVSKPFQIVAASTAVLKN